MLFLIARWVLPQNGFEAYVEWARNDNAWDLRDFLLQPDHSQAFTLGFEKALGNNATRSRLRGEWTALGKARTNLSGDDPVYAAHHTVREGYPHEGQLLGAGIGTGSSSQYLGVDRFPPRGRWGIFAQRVRYDDDAYYDSFVKADLFYGQQVEFTFG